MERAGDWAGGGVPRPARGCSEKGRRAGRDSFEKSFEKSTAGAHFIPALNFTAPIITDPCGILNSDCEILHKENS